MIVGTSTNCSAVCGTERTVRGQRRGVEILGTSMTCSGTKESRAVRNDNSWSTICGTGASRICRRGAETTVCSKMCRWTLSTTFGGSGSSRTPGRLPPELALVCPRRRRALLLATHPSESCGEWPRRAPSRPSSATVQSTSMAPTASVQAAGRPY